MILCFSICLIYLGTRISKDCWNQMADEANEAMLFETCIYGSKLGKTYWQKFYYQVSGWFCTNTGIIKNNYIICLFIESFNWFVVKNFFRFCSCRYHDMPDVIDFLVLKQHYDISVERGWKPGVVFVSHFTNLCLFLAKIIV